MWNGTFRRLFHTARVARAPSHPLSKIRNIGIIAHIDAGKTTTTERMLYYSGITSRIGNVDQGDTVTDFLPAERERGITIQSAAITIPWNNHKINLIDTPGHADFGFEVIRSLKVLDGAVTILDGVAGVEAQTEKVWKQSKSIPKIFFINKMDREGAGFSRTVKEIIAKLGTRVLLLNVPYFVELENREKKFVGVLDIIDKKLLRWIDQDKIEVSDVEGETYEEVKRCRESLIETLGEIDEAVIDSFLEVEDYMKVPGNIIRAAVRKSTLSNYAVPVLAGASFRNIGVQPLMEAVNHYLPSPIECVPEVSCPVTKTNEGFIMNQNKNLTVAMAFKVTTDRIRGIMVFVRVYSGKLKNHATVYVNGEKFKIGKLLVMHANVPQDVTEISAGNIGVIVTDKLKTGDTILSNALNKKLQNKELGIVVNPIIVPPPVFSISLEPRTSGDKRSMDEALEIILREDPSLKVTVDEENGQTLLSGMGELHLEIARDRLRDLKAKLEIGEIMVSYKETVLERLSVSKESVEHDYKISMSVEPKPEFLEENPNVLRVNLGDNNILEVPVEPENWDKVMPYQSCINAFISGSISSIQRGPILKLPLNSVLLKVSSFSMPLDSQNVTLWITLVRQCILELLQDETRYVGLEPVMNVSVDVTSEDIGNVIQDLTSARQGIISSIDEGGDNAELANFKDISETQYTPYDPTLEFIKTRDGFSGDQTVHAVVPLREMIGYLPKLRSLTQGRATYHMEFKGMSPIASDRLVEINSIY